ncbi:GNAT family N-acetyltransferase [Marinomonas epiphytica]
MFTWQTHPFSHFSTLRLYQVLKLRCDIFVVEQNCPYPELDNLDIIDDTFHVYAIDQDQPCAYARIMAPGLVYENALSLGRVLVAQSHRGSKIGHLLMDQCLTFCQQNWPNTNIKISAQAHLRKFYESHGFHTVSTPYLEDNIPHVTMLREPSLGLIAE